ncbi:MAG: LicD family protein [Dysgonamonadaceae bacterium]|jgi:lipopolysaccharide cholinephosphotransferase|nr:LicD family protein [Dysgonamonadaceae bacterium]
MRCNGEGTALRTHQIKILNILSETDKILRRHNIHYWLGFGTLLGAVRHKGFIPWDDDLDICIMRKDRKKLTWILNQELPPHLKAENYTYGFMKICDASDKHIYIDIFSMEKGSVALRKRLLIYRQALAYINGRHSKKAGKLLAACIISLFSLCIVSLARALHFLIPSGRLIYEYESEFYLGLKTHDKKDIFPLRYETFEDAEFPVPYDTDACLTALYGNWRQIPPPEKRYSHQNT